MRKAIYLNVLTQVERLNGTPIESQLALREVDQAIRKAVRKVGTANKLSVDVKRVRLEQGSNPKGTQVAILTYLEGDQDPAANFPKLATSELEKYLLDVFKHPTPPRFRVNIQTIEENTNAVDELADEADNLPKGNSN